MNEDEVGDLQRLEAAVRGLQEAALLLKAQRDVDQAVVAALLMTCPDAAAVRTAWQGIASAWTADRVLLAASQGNDDSSIAGITSRVTQERSAFWNEVFQQRMLDDSAG
jgi:hypothetical protein